LVLLGHERRTIARITLAAAVVSLVVSLLLPKTFTGVIRVLPPQQGQSTAAAMLGQLGGGLAGLAGGSLGIKNPSDLYIGMLKSQTVADALIERFKLKEAYDAEYLVDARKRLASESRFLSDKSGIIAVEADASDPKLAADLANAYVEELHKLTSTLAVTDAAQRRVFFERQLQQVREKLAEAELKLREGIETGGLVSMDAQSKASVESVARLRAQISAKEIQIGAMRSYAAPTNPDLQRADRELSAMREGLSRLESGAPGGQPGAGTEAKGMSNIRLVREVKYNEVMFELLARQYEMARVDEAKEAPVIQVMDRASPPEKKSGPKRAFIVIMATIVGFLTSIPYILARNALHAASLDPTWQARLATLRTAWSRRRN
jgi:uncharacterized protein involved in exopolysaccharide biosynthesis